MSKNIFITGATGSLGFNLLVRLLKKSSVKLFILVHADSLRFAQERMRGLFESEGIQIEEHQNIVLYSGKIESEFLGLQKNIYEFLAEEIDEIFHCAALTGFNLPYNIIKEVNVVGTKNILEFAKKSKIKKVNYISTTFILGNKDHLLLEGELRLGQKFSNSYEQSKYEAEILVHEYRDKGININVFRPSVIVGRYSDGKILNFKLMYETIYLCSRDIVTILPCARNLVHNLIPVDLAANMILVLSKVGYNDTFHIVSPNNTECGHFFKLAAKYFEFQLPRAVSQDNFERFNKSQIVRIMIAPFLPYLMYQGKYSFEMTKKVLDDLGEKTYFLDDDFYLRMFHFYKAQAF